MMFLLSVISFTLTAGLTVTAHVFDLPPSFVVTVMVADPAPRGLTAQFASLGVNEITPVLGLETKDQDTLLSVASDGETVAVNEPGAPPTVRASELWFSATSPTATFLLPPPPQAMNGKNSSNAANEKKRCFLTIFSYRIIDKKPSFGKSRARIRWRMKRLEKARRDIDIHSS
jgi:hypothetical protein